MPKDPKTNINEIDEKKQKEIDEKKQREFNKKKIAEQDKLIDFFEKKDAEGFYAYAEELVLPENNKWRNGEKHTDLYDTPAGKAIEGVLVTLARTKDPDEIAFREALMKITAKRHAAAILEAGRKYEAIREQIENGEIENTEQFAADAKYIPKAAQILTKFRSEPGIHVWDSCGLEAQLVNFRDADDGGVSLRKQYAQMVQDELKADKRFTPQQKEQYFDLFAGNTDAYININSSVATENDMSQVYGLELRKQNGIRFDQIPDVLQKIKRMSNQELVNFRKTLEQDKRCIEEYEKQGKKWVETAKQMLGELNQTASDAEKKLPEYDQLKKALELNTKLGTDITYEQVGGTTVSSFGFWPSTFKDLTDILKNAAEKYPNKEVAGRILEITNRNINNHNAELDKGADRIFKKNVYESHSAPKTIEKDIQRIDIEQKQRSIELFPSGKKMLNDNLAEIQTLTQKQDAIIHAKQEIRCLQTKDLYNLRWFTKDNAARNIPKKDEKKHTEYLDLMNKSKKLAEMDVNKLSPKQIYEQLQQTKAAADRYLSTHKGVLNLTKGWSEEGQNRIKQAQAISKALDVKIKSMEGFFNTFKDDTDNIETVYEDLGFQMKPLRAKNANIKQQIYKNAAMNLTEQNGAIIEEPKPDESAYDITDDVYSIKFSQQSIKRILSTSKAPEKMNKAAVSEHLADIIATKIIANKYGSLDSKDAQERRDELSTEIHAGKAFKNMIAAANTPEAFDRLVQNALRANPNELLVEYSRARTEQKQLEERASNPQAAAKKKDGPKNSLT